MRKSGTESTAQNVRGNNLELGFTLKVYMLKPFPEAIHNSNHNTETLLLLSDGDCTQCRGQRLLERKGAIGCWSEPHGSPDQEVGWTWHF